MNAWHISSLVCTLIGVLLLLIAVSTDYWVANAITQAGLWKLCINNVCAYWGWNIAVYMHVTRAFLIIGLLTGFLSAGLLCALFSGSQIGSFSITKNAASGNYSAGILTLIAMSVFTGVENAGSLFSWSFGLGWACCPLFFIAGGLAHKLHLDNTSA
ncbi:lens fiber membrane intrinsic protein-like [Tiliqua scincoides]|uniref:lens fiber membrane intrinsic protein-like n=1 Tax=Tiliqua scincoides TaxID=71010 RepID=UPI003461D042